MRRPAIRAAVLSGSLVLAQPFLATAAVADGPGFDLAGPVLSIRITRGAVTLPLSNVPSLAAGDRIAIEMPAPADRGSRYTIVLTFLRGATSPPPADWVFEARPWDPKRASIDAVVPAGAEQATILLVPFTGGAIKAVGDAVRGRPGAFVRGVQELTQASLDRARLDAYLAAMHALDGRGGATAADTAALAKSLSVKIDPGCLTRQQEMQAACLAQGGGATVLTDAQTTSLAQNLAGAPADVALAVSSTPQASFGYYSPYIGLVRDLARLFGAFQSAQLQFIPALEIQRGAQTQLYLNTAPSFRRPQSVLVAPMPAVAPGQLPVMTPTGDGALCTARTPLLAGFSGAPLLYATAYARDVRLRVKLGAAGTVELPATADPVHGGYVIDVGADTDKIAAGTEAVLHGLWGFQSFEGPRYAVVSPANGSWRVADRATLVIGRESPLPIVGGAAACLRGATLDHGGARTGVDWTVTGDHSATLKVPLDNTTPGNATLLLDSYGAGEPQKLAVRTYSEPSRLSLFTVHVGERTGTLTGSRLDQVSALEVGGSTWRADTLGRVRSTDRLDMTATGDPAAALRTANGKQAVVTLTDGRTAPVAVAVAPARATATLVSRSLERVGPPPPVPIRIDDPDILPADSRSTFAIRAPTGSRFTPGDQVEVVVGDQGATARLPLHLQDADVAIADFIPGSTLGAESHGAARFRLIQDGTPGEWQPLGMVARLPVIRTILCTGTEGLCTMTGEGLYLLRSITPEGQPDKAIPIPDGFTESSIRIQPSPKHRWQLSLRDAPGRNATISLPQ